MMSAMHCWTAWPCKINSNGRSFLYELCTLLCCLQHVITLPPLSSALMIPSRGYVCTAEVRQTQLPCTQEQGYMSMRKQGLTKTLHVVQPCAPLPPSCSAAFCSLHATPSRRLCGCFAPQLSGTSCVAACLPAAPSIQGTLARARACRHKGMSG